MSAGDERQEVGSPYAVMDDLNEDKEKKDDPKIQSNVFCIKRYEVNGVIKSDGGDRQALRIKKQEQDAIASVTIFLPPK